ncbi:MAG: hypothetical protein V1649_04235 [Patescibacteria group bacterium]
MFDEINNQNSKQTDILASGVGSRPNFNQSIPRQAEDILAGVDQPAKPAVFQPKPAPMSSEDYEKKSATDSKKFFVLGALVIGFILIIGIGYLGIKLYLNSRTTGKAILNNTIPVVAPLTNPSTEAIPKPTDVNENPVNENPIVEIPVSAPAEIPATSSEPIVVVAPQPIDTDKDGLTDEEEKQLGTDPNSIDSDNDGLSDREEVKVYGTNPLNADTDGDGYEDGDEVKNGYNPKGQGKLYEIKNDF